MSSLLEIIRPYIKTLTESKLQPSAKSIIAKLFGLNDVVIPDVFDIILEYIDPTIIRILSTTLSTYFYGAIIGDVEFYKNKMVYVLDDRKNSQIYINLNNHPNDHSVKKVLTFSYRPDIQREHNYMIYYRRIYNKLIRELADDNKDNENKSSLFSVGDRKYNFGKSNKIFTNPFSISVICFVQSLPMECIGKLLRTINKGTDDIKLLKTIYDKQNLLLSAVHVPFVHMETMNRVVRHLNSCIVFDYEYEKDHAPEWKCINITWKGKRIYGYSYEKVDWIGKTYQIQAGPEYYGYSHGVYL